MSTDNRTIINDCEATTGWAGDDSATVANATGEFYEGSASLSTQLSDVDEHMYTTQDSVGMGTFSLDWSDSCIYMIVKDNLGEPFSNGGTQIVIGDGTDRVGYDVGGNDATGVPLATFFRSYKLDVSVVDASPGNFATYAGSEANMTFTAITQIGYGAHHLAKANGPSDNAFMDCFRYIANDSYALTINGGTSGTPETMSDVQGDDVTNGWGMVGNPVGDQFIFFAPTEWGDSGTANSYFTATNEQWYWLGDNGGGHAVGAGHFPFRLIGNATGTNSWVLNNVVIVNTGTGADFDLTNANFDTIEMDGCTLIGLSTFDAPASGGTSRFVENSTFLQCGQVTHGGASMNGCTIDDSTVAADVGAVNYNVNADPNGEMDDMTFVKGTNAHHAIEFGATAPLTMTLTNLTTSGFNASDGQNDSTFLFADRGSDVTWTLNLTGPSGNTSFKKVRAGDTVNISTSVPLEVNGLTEGSNAVIAESGNESNEYMAGYADSAGKVTGSFTGTTPQAAVVKARNGGIVAAAIMEDNGTGFTDYTDEARDKVGANDVNLLPATVSVNDAFYIGGLAKFGEARIDVSTAGDTYVGTWEYWNGAWVALTVTDGTSSFQTAAWGDVEFTAPSDWATTSVNSQGPFYYIRFRVTTGGGTQPQAERVTLNETVKYLPFRTTGSIASGSGLTVTAVWQEDSNNP